MSQHNGRLKKLSEQAKGSCFFFHHLIPSDLKLCPALKKQNGESALKVYQLAQTGGKLGRVKDNVFFLFSAYILLSWPGRNLQRKETLEISFH